MLTANGRYRLGRTLGKGGMGEVYEAVDQKDGRILAFKRLLVDGGEANQLTSLFQREFHTLSRLNHPAVIDVYEYGVDDAGPFYTMERLEGEDLRSVLPLPFERACALLREVASALSLLHTRQLVHRDITSRNIRVVGDHRAKLLDFGALAPIGYSGPVVGTPPFVPPEALFGQPLDARSDLFSLGVVLYQALSGELPYRGRTWAEIRTAWQGRPIDLRELVTGLPPDLVTLTMSLIAPNRSARPRHAGQVMDQLAEIAGLRSSEPPGVVRSYLIAPDLVGRDPEMRRLRDALDRANRSSGGGLLIAGPAGVGRSRLIEEAALEARIAGAVVLSAGPAPAGGGPFAAARFLVEALIAAAPDVVTRAARRSWDVCRILYQDEPRTPPTRAAGGDPGDAENLLTVAHLASFRELVDLRRDVIIALRTLFLDVARECTLAITVDDLARLDEPSAAWLATLLRQATSRRLLVVCSLVDGERAQSSRAHRLICDLSEELRLRAFDADETGALLRTVFGSAPNVEAMAASVFRLSQGLPRDALSLCEHLVEDGLVTYGGGIFFLPARVGVEDLPTSIAATHARVVSSLSPAALHLLRAMTQAAGQSLTLPECMALSLDGTDRTAQLSLDELSQHRIVVSDGYRYRPVHDGWSKAAMADADRGVTRTLHRALARLQGAARDALAQAYHLFLAEGDEEAVAVLEQFVRGIGDDRLAVLLRTKLPPKQVAELLELASEAARRLGSSRAALGDLQHSRMMLGTYVDYASFEALRPIVVEDLKRDSGYRFWNEPARPEEALPAALAAIGAAQAEYDRAAPEQRMRSPEAAIRALVQFAAAGIAVGAQAADWDLRRSLPELLRPFACLSPAIDAIFENCLSVVELSLGQFERYRARSLSVLERLSWLDIDSLPHGEEIRAAVAYGVASAEARMGVPGALHRLVTLEGNPRLRVNAMDLEAYVLLQQGDWKRAAECRRLAEQLDMEGAMGQVFGSKLIRNDAEIHALGGDLPGVSHVVHQLEVLSGAYRGWLPSLHVARGEYERLRGDPTAALAEFDACLALLEPLMTSRGSVPEWYCAAAARTEVLTELHRYDEAVAYGRGLLSLSESWSADAEPEIRFHGIIRALALAEARAGEHRAALDRLEPAIEVRNRWGTTGVYLGILHEARAVIALSCHERELYEQSTQLASDQFRLVEDSAFFWRARRLIESGQSVAPGSGPIASSALESTTASVVTKPARSHRSR